MAGVSTKEIKNRIRSMESTKQITKAMEMVAASKLRRAQAQVMDSRPYFEILHQTITDISVSTQDFSSVYFQEPGQAKVMFVVIAGDRGLAGGYNSNVLKLVEEQIRGQQAEVLPIGKKAVDFFRSRGSDILYEPSNEEVFEAIIPEYLGGLIYGALCESRASEQAARRTAMDNATQNAEDMIDELSLKFNRARQAAITQEITEIVAGS